ncbi:MAG: hypothetical protein IIY98_03320, partial [Aeriscardovia sp.]|nr:hypothetical protein [Aeriscardovia sp.]
CRAWQHCYARAKVCSTTRAWAGTRQAAGGGAGIAVDPLAYPGKQNGCGFAKSCRHVKDVRPEIFGQTDLIGIGLGAKSRVVKGRYFDRHAALQREVWLGDQTTIHKWRTWER